MFESPPHDSSIACAEKEEGGGKDEAAVVILEWEYEEEASVGTLACQVLSK